MVPIVGFLLLLSMALLAALLILALGRRSSEWALAAGAGICFLFAQLVLAGVRIG